LVPYQGGIPARRWSPIPVLTGLNIEQLRSYNERRYLSTKLPTLHYTPGSTSGPTLGNKYGRTPPLSLSSPFNSQVLLVISAGIAVAKPVIRKQLLFLRSKLVNQEKLTYASEQFPYGKFWPIVRTDVLLVGNDA